MKSTKKKHIQDYHMVTISSFREVVQYIYYRFSEFYKRTEGTHTSYRFSGFLLLLAILYFNILSTVLFLSNTYIGKHIVNLLDTLYRITDDKLFQRIVFGGTVGIILSIVLYIMLGRESYLEIYQKFHKETLQQRKKRGWFIAIYMVLTPVIFIIAVFIKHRYF